jgi:PAS domain S-box-containing protein
VGIWDWDVINNKLTWDAQMFRLYGITTDDFSGAYEAWKAGVHPEDVARADAEVQLALRGEKEFDTEFRVVWLNGTIRHLAARAKMQRDAAGQPTKLIGTSHDITARQQAEAEIRELNRSLEQRVQERTAELLAANQELNAFAYAVSHDLRQPLRAMNGFSQALVEDFGATLPGAAHEFLNHIIQGSRRMGELIDGLLRLSRTTRGELRRDAVDLSALAARLLGELAAAEPNRRVTWTVAPGLTARGDERMIEVVLANLLDNAWKYTAKTPQPKIEFGAMEHPSSAVVGKGQDSGAAPSQPAPVFFVRDNGAGFDMQHAAKLFQPFQRLHREDEFPGIGIGLATVQRIVHRHGGAIQATVTPRQGTTFSFSLSAADLTVKDKYESKDHPSGGGHAPG